MKFCVAQLFWVERHLDAVLEVSQSWIKIVTKLVDIYHMKIHWKNYDDCFINEGDILLFKLWKKKKNQIRNIEVSKNFNFWNLKIPTPEVSAWRGGVGGGAGQSLNYNTVMKCMANTHLQSTLSNTRMIVWRAPLSAIRHKKKKITK